MGAYDRDNKKLQKQKKMKCRLKKEKLESVKRADAAVKTMHDFTSPEVLYKELINSVLKYHPFNRYFHDREGI